MYLEILPCALCTSHDAAAAALMSEVKSKYADALQSLARKSGPHWLSKRERDAGLIQGKNITRTNNQPGMGES